MCAGWRMRPPISHAAVPIAPLQGARGDDALGQARNLGRNAPHEPMNKGLASRRVRIVENHRVDARARNGAPIHFWRQVLAIGCVAGGEAMVRTDGGRSHRDCERGGTRLARRRRARPLSRALGRSAWASPFLERLGIDNEAIAPRPRGRRAPGPCDWFRGSASRRGWIRRRRPRRRPHQSGPRPRPDLAPSRP